MIKYLLAVFCLVWTAYACCAAEVSISLGTADVEQGIQAPSGADGVLEASSIANREYRTPVKGNNYFYFRITQPEAFREARSVYVTIDYYDEGFSPIELQYDSTDIALNYEGAYKGGGAILSTDTRQWQNWTFELKDHRFAHRQNLQSDFRLYSGIPMKIARVSVSTEKPPGFDDQRRIAMERLANAENALKPVKGMSVCFGGVEVGSNDQWPARIEPLEQQCALFKSLGVTSTEIYVTWATAEGEAKDQWNWTGYDCIAQTMQKFGLKWVPFVIIGPSYATPKWFKESKESVFARCLDHGQESEVQSIWNPDLLPWVDRFMGEFANRYGKTGVIESVLIGISGDFGEAIMPVWGGGWTGDYHTHAGWWCGDRYAIVDFRNFLQRKYSKIEDLNKAWESSYKSFREIRPVLPKDAISNRAWLDQMAWYIGSMNRWTDQWMALTRKHFLNTQIYLCTGGIAEREHASDFSAQCRIAAKYNAGVRITNEASDYAMNFYLTRWVASAGKHYGCYYGFEPAGAEDEKGIRARLYNITCSGANQYHTYQNNVTSSATRIQSFRDHYPFLRPAKPVVDVAVFIPRTWQVLKGDYFWQKTRELRDLLDFDFVDEAMIRDGALAKYKALVFLAGNFVEQEDLKQIDSWLESGGWLLAYNFGEIKSVEGDNFYCHKWFGSGEPGMRIMGIGKGRSYFYGGGWDQRSGFYQMLREALADIPNRPEPDGAADGVYATVLQDAVLYLNTTDTPVQKSLCLPDGTTREFTVPGNTMYEVKLK